MSDTPKARAMRACGCPGMPGIDVHCHVVPEHFPAALGVPPAGWPSMAPAHECHRHVMIDGGLYRTVSDRCWDAAKRLEDMDTQHVGVQALSPMPELLGYWLPAKDGAHLCRFLNDEIEAMVASAPTRFIGLGAVPMQDIDLAIAELERLMRTGAFAGVELGSNINGAPVGAPRFDAFFEAAQALGAAIFVHALRPAGTERLIGPKPLLQALAYPTDVGLAAASVLTSNLIVRRPRLRIAFSHGGGTLASLLPRLEQAHKVFAPLAETMEVAPREQSRRLYYDTLVFDDDTLAHLVHQFGHTQLMLGTDYPFAFREHAPVARLAQSCADADVRAHLVHRNAERFLGIASRSQP